MLASPAPPAAAACKIAAAGYSGPEELSWLGEALPLYLEYYCLSIAGAAGARPEAVALEAVMTVEDEKAVVDVTLAFPDGVRSSAALAGPPGEGPSWMADLGGMLIREGVFHPDSVLPSGPPTTDAEALRHFAAALSAGDTPTARRSLERAVERDGTFLEARWLLAVAAYRRGDWAVAEKEFGAVAAGRPGLPAPLLNEALSLFRSGRMQEGADRLEKAAALRPESPAVSIVRGKALAAGGLLEDAVEVFADLLSREPSQEEAFFAHALLTARIRGSAAAEARLESLTAEATRRGRDYFHRFGQMAFGSGDLSAARSAFELALVADPDYSPSSLALAVVKYTLGEYEDAVADLSAAARELGGDPDVYRYLGLAYEKLGNTEAAMESFRRSTEFLAQQGGDDLAKSLFLESLGESHSHDGYPPVIPGLYLKPLAGFWKGERVRRIPAPLAASSPAGGGFSAAIGSISNQTGAGAPSAPAVKKAATTSVQDPVREKEDQAVRLAREALAAQKALRELQDEKLQLAERVQALQEANAGLRGTVLERDEALLSLEVMLDEYRRQINEFQTGAAGAAAAGDERLHNEEIIERLRGELEAAREDRDKERDRARRHEAQVAELEQEARALREKGGVVCDERVDELEGENRKLSDLLAGFRSDAAAWEMRERDLKEEQREMQARLSSLEREIGRLEQKLEIESQEAREAAKSGEEQAGLAARMEAQAREAAKEKEALRLELDEAREQISRLEGEVRSGGKRVSGMERQLAAEREEREEIAKKLRRAEEAGDGLQEKVIELEEALSAAEKREAEGLKRQRKTEKKLGAAEGARAGLEEKLKETEALAASTREDGAQALKEVKRLKKQIDKASRVEADLEKQLAAASEERDRLRSEVGERDSLKKKAASREKEIERLKVGMAESERELTEFRRRCEEAAAARDAAVRLKEEATDLTEKLQEELMRLGELEAENARLRSLTERMAKKLRDSATEKASGDDSP